MVNEVAPKKAYGVSVQVPKAAELVAGSLRRQIVRGDIRDGEALPSETALMEQFGVSRPTLREALRVLESENLITVRRGTRGGATAHQMSAKLVSRYASLLLQSRGTTLADVYHAQLTFEPACVRDLALSRSEEDVQTLRQVLADERETVRSDNDERARVGFHYKLIELSGNQTLILLSRLISDLLLSVSGDTPVGVDAQKALHDHERIIDLISAKDAAGAHDFWRSHLEEARQRVLQHVGGDKRVIDILG